MKYTRKFSRQHKAMRARRWAELSISILSGVMAMCLAFSTTTLAADLSRNDSGVTKKDGNNYDVYAGKLIANKSIAVNDFGFFVVNGGDKVNMHFGTAQDAARTNKLVNMVSTKIDIAGTVNAVSSMGSGKGDIYFMSPTGMVVSGQGVINATNIYVSTPSLANYLKMRDDDAYMQKVVEWGDSIDAHSTNGEFPLSSTGFITVDSFDNLNATEGTYLLSEHIDVLDSGIKRADEGDVISYITENGKLVMDIFAGEVFPNSDIALNVFDRYNIKTGETANMYFGTLNGTSDDGIYNLINLVKSKIDINGTVNAIKANPNEANLYFLSSDGFAVGADGVINAGSLLSLTPTKSAFGSLLSGGVTALRDLTTNPEKIEIDPNSSITISGVINTYNGIYLRAGHRIDVVADKKADGTQSIPKLRSSNLFANMVKLTPEQEAYVKNTKEMNLTRQLNGDISLSVVTNNGNNEGNILQSGDKAIINQEGFIKSRGNVNITAEASAKDDHLSVLAPAVEADVNIKGKIVGQNVNVKATAENTSDGNLLRTGANFLLKQGLSQIPGLNEADLTVSVQKPSSKAQVNVEKDAEISAAGPGTSTSVNDNRRSLNISADSKLTFADEAKKWNWKKDKNSVNLAGVWDEANNDAVVNIEGRLHAHDGVDVSSHATADVDVKARILASSRADKGMEKGQPYSLAGVRLDGGNRAKTVFAKGSELMVDRGNVDITSKAEHSLSSVAVVKGDKEGALSLGLNYTTFNSDARTEMGAGVTTPGKINIDATNEISKNTITTSSVAGMTLPYFHSYFDDAILGDDGLWGMFLGSGSSVDKYLHTGSWFSSKAGASPKSFFESVNGSFAFQRAVENNNATVLIHQVPIQAGDKLDINAKLNMKDINYDVDSKAYNRQHNSTNVKTLVDAGVLWSTMGNHSNVIIDSAEKDTNGSFNPDYRISGKNVSITAKTELPQDALERARQVFYSYNPINSKKSGFWAQVWDKAKGLIPGVNTDTFEKYWGLVELNWLTLGQYGNFSVRAMTDKGTATDESKTPGSTSTGFSGAFNINNVENTSSVIVGANRSIQSIGTPLVLDSKVTGTLTSITGNPGDRLTPTTSKGGMVGGSVSTQTIDNKSINVVGQNSELTGSKVSVTAENEGRSYGLIVGSGVAEGSAAVNGMVNLMRGEQTAIAAVDKSASIIGYNGDVLIKAYNDPVVFNLAAGIMANSDSKSSVAVAAELGAGLNMFDVNTFAGTTDTSLGAADRENNAKIKTVKSVLEKDVGYALSDNLTKEERQKLNEEAKANAAKKGKTDDASIAQERKALLYGRTMGTGASNNKGEIIGDQVSVQAETQGAITSVAVNGAVTDDGASKSVVNGMGKVTNWLPNQANTLLGKVDEKVGKGIMAGTKFVKDKLAQKFGSRERAAEQVEMEDLSNANKEQDQNQGQAAQDQSQGGSLAIGLAGSGAVNALNENTIAVIDTDDVKMYRKGKAEVSATEAGRNMAISGAGVLNAFTKAGGETAKTTVGASGTLAMNDNNHIVIASMRGANVHDAGEINVTANTTGDEMALGLGADVSINSSQKTGASVNAGAMLGLNIGTRSTEASLEGTDGTNRNAVYGQDTKVNVQAKDVSNAKALSFGVVGGKGVDVGLAGAYNGFGTADNPHTVSAAVRNMQIHNAQDISVTGVDDSTLYTAAGALSGSSNGSVAGDVSYAHSDVKKKINATVENTDIDNDKDHKAGKLTVKGDNSSHINTLSGTAALSFGGAAGASGSVGIGASVAVNTIKTDVDANVIGGNQKLADGSTVKAKTNANVMSVGVGAGGTLSGAGGGAGSVSYNSVTNNADTKVSGSTMYSKGSLGVLAESDDRLNNIVGSLTGSRKVALGLSLGMNNIDGRTNATVENSNITALGNEGNGITVSNITDQNMIRGRLRNPYNGDNRLTAAREDKQYQGLVVHSSATHDVSSVQGTAGITVSVTGSSAANGVGTVVTNDIGGETTALIKDSKVNAGVTDGTSQAGDKVGNNNVTVLAQDFTNDQSITGTGSVNIGLGTSSFQGSGAGSGEKNAVSRLVTAKIIGNDTNGSDYSIRAKDLNVNAMSEQATSTVDLAGALSISGMSASVAAAASMSFNTLDSMTQAAVENANILYGDKADIHATHDGRIYGGAGSMGIAVSLKAAGGVGFAMATDTDASTTDAYVLNSKIKSDKDGSKVSVKADGYTLTDNLLGAVGIAITNPKKPIAGSIAGALAKNVMRSTTTARVQNSTLEGDHVEVLSHNKDEIKNLTGDAALSVGGAAGAGVIVNYLNDKVDTVVRDSILHAYGKDTAGEKALTINATADRVGDDSAGSAAIAIGSVNMNWIETKVNYDENDKPLSVNSIKDADGKVIKGESKIDEVRDTINKQDENLKDIFGDLFSGLSAKTAKKESDYKYGVHTVVKDSRVEAENGKANVSANENNGFQEGGLSIGVGAAGAYGSVTKLKEKHQMDVTVQNSTISSQESSVTATRGNIGEGNYVHSRLGSITVGSGTSAWGSVTSEGNTGIVVEDSNIISKAGKTTINAMDNTTNKTVASGLNLIGVNLISYNDAITENNSSVSVNLNSTNDRQYKLAGTEGVEATATKSNETSAEGWGYGVGAANGEGALAKAEENGNATVTVDGSHYTFEGGTGTTTLKAYNRAKAKATVSGEGSGAIGVIRSKGEAYMNGNAETNVAGDNTFVGKSADIGAVVGTQGQQNAYTTVTGGAASLAFSIEADSAIANTDTKAIVHVGSENYLGQDGQPMKVVNIMGENYSNRYADLVGHSGALTFSNGANEASVLGNDLVIVSAAGGKVRNLNITSENESTGYAVSRNTTVGVMNVSPYAAAARNEIYTGSQVRLTGKWDVIDTLTASANETDVAKAHADSTNVGGGAIGSADVSSKIHDYKVDDRNYYDTRITFDSGAKIYAGRLSAKSKNDLTITKADGYDETVSTGSFGILGITQNPGAVQNIQKASQIMVEKRADGQDTIHTSSNQLYEASTVNKVDSKVFGSSGGLVGEAGVKSTNDVSVVDFVSILGNISSTPWNGITISAWDSSDLSMDSEAKVSALFGGSHVNDKNKLTRINKIEVYGNIHDTGRVNMYVNKKADGSIAQERIHSVAYNNDVAVGTTNDPLMNTTLLDYSNIYVDSPNKQDIGTLTKVLNQREGLDVSSILKRKVWKHWFLPFDSEIVSTQGKVEFMMPNSAINTTETKQLRALKNMYKIPSFIVYQPWQTSLYKF